MFLMQVFLVSGLVSAGGTLPEFTAWMGKSHSIAVAPERSGELRTGRLSIRVAEHGSGSQTFIEQMREAGFPVGAGSTVEFLIPASACTFFAQDIRVFTCNTNNLAPDIFESVEVVTDNLRLHGSDLTKTNLVIRLGTVKTVDSTVRVDGSLRERQFIGLHSNVLIHSSDVVNGYFRHDLSGMNLN